MPTTHASGSAAGSAGVVVATSIPPAIVRSNKGESIDTEYQRLCLRSWAECGFRILSVNQAEEIPALAARFPEVGFVAAEHDLSAITRRKNPAIADMLTVLAGCPEPVTGIVNADIVLQPTETWVRRLPAVLTDSMLIGNRYDTSSLSDGALRRYDEGFDHFFFRRDWIAPVLAEAPAFCLGLPWWDYWFPLAFALRGHGVRVCEAPYAVHLAHPTVWDTALWRQFAATLALYIASNATRAPAELLPLAQHCRRLAPLADSAEAAEGLLDDSFTEMGQLCISALLRDGVRIESLAGRLVLVSEPQTEGASPREAEGRNFMPKDAFHDFSLRAAAAHLTSVAASEEKAGNASAAARLYGRALQHDTTDRELLLRYGRFLLLDSTLSGHLELFADALRKHPNGAVIANDLGIELIDGGHSEAAIWILEQALALSTTLFGGYYNLGVATHMGGRNCDDVIARFAAALTLAPGHAEGTQLFNRLCRYVRTPKRPAST